MRFIGKLQVFWSHIKDCGCPSQATNVGSIPIARSTSQVVRKAEHPECCVCHETNKKNTG